MVMITMGSPGFNLCLSTLFVLPLLIAFLSQTRTEAAATYLFHDCPNATTFTTNSTYENNSKHLLASLSSNATRATGFYNTTASTPNSVETVYGLFLCRGDISAADCRDCVSGATEDVVERCPKAKDAVAWYEYCMLRYAKQYFFSSMVTDPGIYMWNTVNVSEPSRFDQLVRTTMNDLASGISNVGAGAKKFGTKEANFTALQTLYTLAQCTLDISRSDCNSCLQRAIASLPGCCGGKQGGRILFPSCNVRFEVYPFYQSLNTSAPTPSTPALVPPPPGSVTAPKGKDTISVLTIVAIVGPISVSIVLFVIGYCFVINRRARKKYNAIQQENAAHANDDISTVESLQFDLATIEISTNKFSDDNKLGEGGFGVVYKGRLSNGQEIAVKRLSRNSGQGDVEFKNEVLLVAKLQHRNLVRLLGFCLEGNERLLIYEFVPKISLDYYIFDPMKGADLDWGRRYKIIGGIARGLLYLHEDSRLRIIHRDLKTGNILLDANMNPKISDFGMARLFVLDQTEGSTNRIVGTYGYMAPEYAMFGQFSTKSDVFSFGILILEIISGQKITNFRDVENMEYLLSYAWRNWREGTTSNLIDPTLMKSGPITEMMRCIHIGLLCVQQNVADRPEMTSIVLMLNSDSVALPVPTQPASFMQSNVQSATSLQVLDINCGGITNCEVSISELYPR
ncbi:cysteine-rich receptor-like protein kinase 10 [Corylus avellana]|uniref:cysteine-rich receptor-like protein kinase 10 n=1 Tax=Corylus avellana TaxID=13451 RepID=UPI00286B7DF7|nr:cysteine-rich receptor-like protein kinase 10 [Corylus avellana]